MIKLFYWELGSGTPYSYMEVDDRTEKTKHVRGQKLWRLNWCQWGQQTSLLTNKQCTERILWTPSPWQGLSSLVPRRSKMLTDEMKTRTYHLDPFPWSCHFVAALPLCVPVPQTDWEPACCSAWSEESGRAVLCEPDAQRCFWNCAPNQLSPRQSCNRNKLVSALRQHFSWWQFFVSQMLRNVSPSPRENCSRKKWVNVLH